MGGRILRGLLAYKLPYLTATRYAKNVGQIIALVFVVVGFRIESLVMLPVIAVFIYYGAITEENMTRVKIILGDKRVRDFLPEDPALLRMNDPIDSALRLLGPSKATAIAVTDERQTLKGAVTVKDVAEAVRKGEGSAPVSSIVNPDVPLMDADTPASQAYYFLNAGKKPFAGIQDGEAFLGLIFYDSLLG